MLGLSLAAAAALTARADSLEMTNGDHYEGTVLGMNQSNILFQSDVLGRVTLSRAKVGRITLHEVAAPKPAAPSVVTAVAPTAPSASAPAMGQSLILYGTNRAAVSVPAGQADVIVQQMRQQGIDPKIASQVQEQILGQGSPEATAKYNELMGGFLSGSLSIQDIRAQALDSIKEIQDLKKDAGDDTGGMLDGYLAILENFVQETATNSPTDSAAATPAKPPVK